MCALIVHDVPASVRCTELVIQAQRVAAQETAENCRKGHLPLSTEWPHQGSIQQYSLGNARLKFDLNCV